jgi:hypothetical protein
MKTLDNQSPIQGRVCGVLADLCPRCGQSRKETLIARFGGDLLMPDVEKQYSARSGEVVT